MPGKLVNGMGGATDRGARLVIVLMEHATKDGAPKIPRTNRLPYTGRRVIDRVITDLAVLDITATGLVLRELAPGATKHVRAATEAPLTAPAP